MSRKFWFIAAVCLAGCGAVHRGDAPAEKPSVAAPVTAAPPPSRSTVGNGSDYFSPEHDSAWFLGEKPIEYCVRAKNAATAEWAQLSIDIAFERWRNYLRKLRVNDPAFHPERDIQPGDPALTMNAHLRPSCDGGEELTIYLGVEDARVTQSLTQYNRPYAISERTEYHPDTGRGKGFVWIAAPDRYGKWKPDWSDGHPLTALLLHELGHVAGCGHVRNTVMDEDLAALVNHYDLSFERIGNDDAWDRIDYWGIKGHDSWHQLFACPRCDYKSSEWYNPKDAELGKALLGEAYDGYALYLGDKPAGLNDIPFVVVAHGAAHTFHIRDLALVAEVGADAPVFRAVFQRGEKLATVVSYSGAAIYQGTVDGIGLPVLLEWNTDGESFALSHVTADGKRLRLFELETILESNGIIE